jgi:hypothetical protein
LDEGRVGGGDGVRWIGDFAGVVEEFGGFVLDLEDGLDGGEITEDVDEGCETYERGREDELIPGLEFSQRKSIEKRAGEGMLTVSHANGETVTAEVHLQPYRQRIRPAVCCNDGQHRIKV